jgi:hypothetical protein
VRLVTANPRLTNLTAANATAVECRLLFARSSNLAQKYEVLTRSARHVRMISWERNMRVSGRVLFDPRWVFVWFIFLRGDFKAWMGMVSDDCSGSDSSCYNGEFRCLTALTPWGKKPQRNACTGWSVEKRTTAADANGGGRRAF